MNIEWKEGVVCFADGKQWFVDGEFLRCSPTITCTLGWAFVRMDFRLNTINQGDFIPKSEINTVDKCNSALGVFGLFGFNPYLNCNMDTLEFVETLLSSGCGLIADSEGDLVIDYEGLIDDREKERKITFSQLDAIGELKRLMNERDKKSDTLTSEEETELKSRAMVSELERRNDKWPQVGDDVLISNSSRASVTLPKDVHGNYLLTTKSGFYVLATLSDLKKPKTDQELKIEDLQTKLIENNAVDNWMLANDILNGKVKGLTYKGDL